MPLTGPRDMFAKALAGGFAVGAFNINNMETVQGILQAAGDERSPVILQVSNGARQYAGRGYLRKMAEAASEETVDLTLSRVLGYLETIMPSENSYRAFSQTQILGVLDTLMALLTTLLSGIASISLIVGGIGIMNIMLVTVRERTKEIGIRKALGARQSQILAQFLIEAVIITSLGGVLGLAISYLGTLLITYITDFNVILGLDAVLLSLVFSLTIGVVFGLYPAYTASKLEPVEALRFE